MAINLSSNFTLEEATHSQEASRRGIDNTEHPQSVITSASHTAVKMELVRDILMDKPINVSSWIRCLELNRALGSKDDSQHVLGEAVDFTCPKFGSPTEICRALIKAKNILVWDQLILEHTWVHISFKSLPNAVNRGQVLSLLSSGKYAQGLTSLSGSSLT